MTKNEKTHDVLFVRFQFFQTTNPVILTIINRAKMQTPSLSARDFLQSMWPLFDGLQSAASQLGKLPRISASSAETAWQELCNAPADVLNGETFDQFRDVIELDLRPSIKTHVSSPEIRQQVERTFAIILRMVQIQLTGTKADD